MKRNLLLGGLTAIAGIGLTLTFVLSPDPGETTATQDLPSQKSEIRTPLFGGTPMAEGDEEDTQARLEYEMAKIVDPATGKVPENMRMRELAYAQTLPQNPNSASRAFNWTNIGPYNIGGRTRAFAADVTNEDIMHAGGISGGMWRSVNGGSSWARVSPLDEVQSVSCVIQDTRPGKTNTWYYGTGESIGNSASASFSANYLGNGVYKSTDGGLSWSSIPSTASNTPQAGDDWDLIWNMAIDPSEQNVDEVYAAASGRVFRSTDGGINWTVVLGATGLTSQFMDIAVTSTGVVYASLSSGGANAGIYRSDDGISWTNITPGGFPGTYRRMRIGIDPNDEDRVYFFGSTPGFGLMTNVFFGGTEYNSLWKYEYLSGNGAGANGTWSDLSQNLPNNINDFGNLNSQGSYNLAIAIQPGNPDNIFIGATNIYRSTDGFTTPNNTSWIGGYAVNTELPYFEIYENHHPDQHVLFFSQNDPNVLFSGHDGGLGRTDDCLATTVDWTSLNNGYLTTQFYTVAIDHGTHGSELVVGGLQDNGTRWTNSSTPSFPWTFPSTGDGSFCAITDGGNPYYFSRQRGRLLKTELDNDGEVVQFNRFDPIGGTDYLFINPFVLDPRDNNVMYLSEGPKLWRNDSLYHIPYDNEYDSISLGWHKYSNTNMITNNITAMAVSLNPSHSLFVGTSSRRLYRIDSANTGDPTPVDITGNINSGSYTHCIAVDPRDADKLIAVYSNYNVYSLWYTENGGQSWEGIAGNLEEPQPPNFPPGIGDGPSCRWASIIPDDEGGTIYLVGTSTGLYMTDTLMGDSTVWVQEGIGTIGHAIVDMMDVRYSDGYVALATHGNGMFSSKVRPVGTSEIQAPRPKMSVYPNPSSDQTTIEFELPENAQVELTLMDAMGRRVKQVMYENRAAGKHRIPLSTADLPAGAYFCSLRTGKERVTVKMLVK